MLTFIKKWFQSSNSQPQEELISILPYKITLYPDSWPYSPSIDHSNTPSLTLISGAAGSGKTTEVLSTIERLRSINQGCLAFINGHDLASWTRSQILEHQPFRIIYARRDQAEQGLPLFILEHITTQSLAHWLNDITKLSPHNSSLPISDISDLEPLCYSIASWFTLLRDVHHVQPDLSFLFDLFSEEKIQEILTTTFFDDQLIQGQKSINQSWTDLESKLTRESYRLIQEQWHNLLLPFLWEIFPRFQKVYHDQRPLHEAIQEQSTIFHLYNNSFGSQAESIASWASPVLFSFWKHYLSDVPQTHIILDEVTTPYYHRWPSLDRFLGGILQHHSVVIATPITSESKKMGASILPAHPITDSVLAYRPQQHITLLQLKSYSKKHPNARDLLPGECYRFQSHTYTTETLTPLKTTYDSWKTIFEAPFDVTLDLPHFVTYEQALLNNICDKALLNHQQESKPARRRF